MLQEAFGHHQASRFLEAEQLYRKILSIDPRHADSLHLLGLIEQRNRHVDSAIELMRQAVEVEPARAHYHSNLGTALMAQAKLDEAVESYQRALALDPKLAEARINLGSALQAQGKLDEAAAHHEQALAIKPDLAEGFYNLGNIRAAQGRFEDAVESYRRALTLRPDYVDAHTNLGAALAALDRTEEAIAHYRRALELNPRDANAHSNLGSALASQGRTEEAIAHYRQALASNPNHGPTHNNLGNALSDLDRTEEAIAHYRQALAINPGFAEPLNNLANIFRAQGRFDEALDHYNRAIAIRPDYAEAHIHRSEIKHFQRGDPELSALETLASSDALPARKKIFIHFALAKALDDLGEYNRAFEHLRNGNALKRARIDYDESAVLELFPRITQVFDRDFLDARKHIGDPSSLPVFVLGMPRSGSTLVEQILAGHPQIQAEGELLHLENMVYSLTAGDPPVPFPECVPHLDSEALRRIGQEYLSRLPKRSEGKLRIVDKLSGNFLSIGLIRLILPNARIIHTVRDPVDTCLSCYSRLFTAGLHFTYDLAELGRYYRAYAGLMNHWRAILPPGVMIDVAYEDVVKDLESQARRLIHFCGLPWDDRCLHFHQTDRPVKTASAVQVRQPLFRDSLGRWRRYEAELAPLLRELR